MKTLFFTAIPHAAQTTAAALRRCLQQAHTDTYAGGNSRLMKKMQRAGVGLGKQLLSDEQREELREIPRDTELEIVAPLSLQAIPWEAVRIDDEWLGERFAVIRSLPVSDRSVEQTQQEKSPPGPDRLRQPGSLQIIVAESPELIAASAELTGVTRRLRYLHHDYPEDVAEPTTHRRCPTPEQVLNDWSRTAWLHFAGHAVPQDGARHLLLASAASRPGTSNDSKGTEKTLPAISPADIARQSTAPEIAILNACGALEVPVESPAEESLLGVLLDQGCRWIVGPTVPVRDSQTRVFVDQLYGSLVEGSSVAQAVLAARRESSRRLGTDNLLGLSYVAYGPAGSSPLTTILQKSAPTDPQWSKPRAEVGLSNRPESLPQRSELPMSSIDKRDAHLPSTCSVCRKTIETPDGIGRLPVAGDDRLICWSCHRAATKDTTREWPPRLTRNLAAASGSAKGAETSSATNTSSPGTAELSEPLPEAVVDFIRHAQECLSRPFLMPNLEGDSPATVSFRPNSAGHPPHDGIAWRRSWTMHSASSDVSAKVTVLALVPQTNEASGDDEAAVSKNCLQQLIATESRPTEQHHFIFAASACGFTQEASQWATAAEEFGPWPHKTTLYLYDMPSGATQHRETDVMSWNLAHLLNRMSTGRQFVTATEHLAGQLPLATSLSAQSVALEQNLELDAVEAAMRLTAFRHGLTLEETASYGLVLSDVPRQHADLRSSPDLRISGGIRSRIARFIRQFSNLLRWRRSD